MRIFSQSWRGEEPSSLAIPTRETMMRQSAPFDETIPRVEPAPTVMRDHIGNIANGSCSSNERSPPEQVGIISRMMNALDDIFSEVTTGAISNPVEGPSENPTSGATHPSIDDFETIPIIGTKRGRQPSWDSKDEDSEVEECISRLKRICTSRVNGTNTLGQVRDIRRDIASRDPQLQNNPTITTAAPIPKQTRSETGRLWKTPTQKRRVEYWWRIPTPNAHAVLDRERLHPLKTS